jgi:hypothetical protein
MTPMESFQQELHTSGYAYTSIPGSYEVCACDPVNGLVYIGIDIPSNEIGIVGLHELGHAHTMTPVVFFFLFNPIIAYSYELAAWAWAEEHMPIGYEKDFEKVKEQSLKTYYTEKMLDERNINFALLIRG